MRLRLTSSKLPSRWRGWACALALTVCCGGVLADDPMDAEVVPRYGRYASTQAYLQGGEADRLGLEAEKAPIPGADDSAVEIDPEPDAEGNAKWVHFRLEVIEVQEEVYPGEYVTFWVYAPLGKAMGSAARLPSPTLRVQQGDQVRVTLYNTHYLPHTIHFHGLSQSAAMDGVPDMPRPWVKPGENFTYSFTAGEPGTYFYHCHVHEQVHVPMGLGGMFVVEPRRPYNHFARLVPGAGRIAVPAKGTAEQYQREYSLVFLDIDDRLNRIAAAYADPREVERRMHRDYDTTQRVPDIFLLNGRAFPFTLRDSPIVVQPDEHTKLRILNMGGRPVYFHTHGHHPTLTDVDGRPVPPAARLTRDTFDVGPAQRIDLSLDTGSRSPNAAGPGHWMVHDHTPVASTNKGIGPGGNHTMIVYEEPAAPGLATVAGMDPAAHAMHMHARFFDPAYYQGRQPVFEPEIFNTTAQAYRQGMKAARPAGGAFDYPVRPLQPAALPRLDRIDAERHRPIASACTQRAKSFKRLVLKAGRAFGRPGEVFAFQPRQLRVERCQEVELVLENTDAVRHDLMVPGLNPMLTMNVVGPATLTTRFITPDADVTLPFHCHVAAHDRVGMLGELIVGKGGIPKAALVPVADRAPRLFDGVGTVLAVLPRQGRVLIKHDAIKGYMAAMEMSFAVARPELMQDLREGDKVAFKVNGTTSQLVEVRLLDRPR